LFVSGSQETTQGDSYRGLKLRGVKMLNAQTHAIEFTAEQPSFYRLFFEALKNVTNAWKSAGAQVSELLTGTF
jgi:hypothetical protein